MLQLRNSDAVDMRSDYQPLPNVLVHYMRFGDHTRVQALETTMISNGFKS
jgi:hypothetical protein